jgi:carbonic anhydrase
MTTPPCQAGIYWNVLSTVYPIKEDHLDQVRRFLATDPKLKKGNFRKI